MCECNHSCIETQDVVIYYDVDIGVTTSVSNGSVNTILHITDSNDEIIDLEVLSIPIRYCPNCGKEL